MKRFTRTYTPRGFPCKKEDGGWITPGYFFFPWDGIFRTSKRDFGDTVRETGKFFVTRHGTVIADDFDISGRFHKILYDQYKKKKAADRRYLKRKKEKQCQIMTAPKE